MRRTHPVKLSIPRQNILVVKPRAHDVAELKAGLVQRPLHVTEGLLHLRARPERPRGRPEAAEQTVARPLVLVDGPDDPVPEAHTRHHAAAHRKRLHAGERRAVAAADAGHALLERHVCIDTTASGGNAQLLAEVSGA